MIRQAISPTIVACLFLSGALPAAGQEPLPSTFSIKPSEVVIPDGAELGKYRRTIQPFENWELRCDENLKSKKKICNITQTILDGQGQFLFSWSLAATEDGKPLMILRARPGLGPEKPISLTFPGRKEPVLIAAKGCDTNVCLGLLPVGPVLREQIAKAAIVHISYEAVPSQTLEFDAPLQGLSKALAAIK
jgi:invasion protein IalB